VLITGDGRVKVVDFGLARASAAVGNTRAGMIIGSVAYIAPEQVTGAPSDARSDVYSAGIVLFEMLTGRQPFSGETPLAVAYAHVNSDVPVVSTVVGGIPPGVDQLVRAATGRDPRQRPADAGAFLRVTRALRGLPEPAESVTGAWAVPPAPGGGPYDAASAYGGGLGDPASRADGLAGAGAGSHTMVVDPGYAAGYGEMTAGHDGGPGRGGFSALLRGGGEAGGHGPQPGSRPGAGEREPFLQRWLFSSRLVYVLAGALVLIGLGGGGWYLTSGRYTSVPAVGKLTETAATQTLHAAGFQVRTGPAMIDDNVPKGEVIGTSPAGRALPGATIVLTISQGPRMITVPQIPAGESVAQATAVLRKAGLTVASTTEPVGGQSYSQIGNVAGTTPAGGTSVPENKPVSVNVIEGLALPNLVGQNISAVQQWASSNQITVQPTTVQSSQQQGTIVAQSPAPQTPVKQGATVSVSVSAGPPQVPIPDVTGQSCQQGQQTLQQAGFQVQVQQGFFGNVFGDNVQSMSPTGQAPSGTTITLQCGRGHF
jgi:serine/threonine-protein kinase